MLAPTTNRQQMSNFDFHCPTQIVSGAGRLAELGKLARSLVSNKVLVVSDPGIEEVGHTQRGADALRSEGLDILVFDGVQENPTTENVDSGLAVAREFEPELIVAIGGGSSMDCAKGINFVYSCGGTMHDYWGVGKATTDLLPMIAVPTTAGTGSETQSFALISDAESHVKMACGDKRAAFRIALLDPELTLTQPAKVTALTGIDALSHTLETMVTTRRNAMSMLYTREAWARLSDALPVVFADPKNLEARSDVQLGAMFAGLAIENSMLGSAHAAANPLTAAYDVVHGEAVGLMLPAVIRRNDQVVGDVYQELTGMTGAKLADFVEQIRTQAGLAGTLSDCGVDPARLGELAAAASKQWTGTFNPISFSEHDYEQLYSEVYQ